MAIIQVNSLLSTKIHSEFNNISTIEVSDQPFAEGGFGAVYECKAIDGKPPPLPQVIKIFKQGGNHNLNTIQKLQRKLQKENEHLLSTTNKNIIEHYPALKAIPQFSFEGTLNGTAVQGFSSTNLKQIGFEEFKDILEQEPLRQKYMKLPFEKKVLMALRLVSGFKLLHKLPFIHADLKPEAIFVNLNTYECAIIDFDSGAVIENPSDKPNTWGAPNDWVAPEIWEQLKQMSVGRQQVQVDLLCDLWSVAVGIHYLLTPTHPLFYLTELSPRVTKDYFKKYKWPDIDENEPYFNKNNENIYKKVKPWLEQKLPKPIFNEFYKTINYGYNEPLKRTTYVQWERVLSSIFGPPKILVFQSNRFITFKELPITLEWEVENADTVEIYNIGQVPLQGKKELKISKTTTFKLIAKNVAGELAKQIKVTVANTPDLTQFIPTPPTFRQNIRTKIDIPRFKYNLQELKLENKTIELPKPIEYNSRIINVQTEIKNIRKRLDNIYYRNKLTIIYEKIKQKIRNWTNTDK